MSVPTDSIGRKAPTPTSVYKYYDESGVLLYVGITSRNIRRQREHNADKEWWRLVSTQEVEHYPSRPHAEAREAALIRSYCPPFNTRHNPWWREVREAYYNTPRKSRDRGALVSELYRAMGSQKTFRLEVVDYNDTLLRLRTLEEDQRRIAAIDPEARRGDLIIESSGRKMTLSHAGIFLDGNLSLLLQANRGVIVEPRQPVMKVRVEKDCVSIKHISLRMPTVSKRARKRSAVMPDGS